MLHTEIDGLKVNKKTPFEVFEGLPRNSSLVSNKS